MDELLHDWGTGARARLLLVLVAGYLVLAYGLHMARSLTISPCFCDFGNYYFFTRELAAGTNVYAIPQAALDSIYAASPLPVAIAGKADYAPLFFVALRPLARLPFWTANGLFVLANQLVLAACVWLAFRLARARIPDRVTALCAVVIVLFPSQALFDNLYFGQTNLLILLALLCAAQWRATPGGRLAAGIVFGAALLLKPQFALALLPFLLEGDLLLCAVAAGTAVLLHVAGTAAAGLPVERAYLQNILHSTAAGGEVPGPYNISSHALAVRLFHGLLPAAAARLLYLAASLALAAVTVRALWRARSRDFLIRYGAAVCLVLLVSPLSEEHHLVVTAVPFLAALLYLPAGPARVLAALAFWIVMPSYCPAAFPVFRTTGLLSACLAVKLLGVFLLWLALIRGLAAGGVRVDKAASIGYNDNH
jgi:hypothetical protein